jgi:hypothetical protein
MRWAACWWVGVVLAVGAWSGLVPWPNLARARRAAVPPAQLDASFVRDLGTLVEAIPEGEEAVVLVPDERQSMATWYWTMAAYLHPDRRWVRPGPQTDAAEWLVGRRGTSAGEAAVRCGDSWCLWRR